MQEGGIGHEGCDQQHVDGQPRRAGHERGDQNGRQAVALVLDGARGHDGRNGAGVGGEQRNEGLAVQSDGAHDAVGDQRGAGQVARVFQNADEEKEQQDLGQKDEHRGDALPDAVEQQRLNPAGGQERAQQIAAAGQQVAKAVRERLAHGEDDLKHTDDDGQKQQRSPDAVEQDIVDLAGLFDRKRSLVAGAPADLRGPGVRTGRIAQDGQRQRFGGGAVARLVEKQRNRVQTRSVGGADLGHRGTQLPGKFQRIHLSAARLHQVAHVQQDHGGQPQRQHGRGQHQLAGEMQRIEDDEYGVGLGRAGHLAAQHIDGDARVLGVRRERVDAGQIDEGEVFTADSSHGAHALFHGHAGIVGHLLAQAGQAVEEGGFATVRGADQDDRLDGSIWGWCGRRNIGWKGCSNCSSCRLAQLRESIVSSGSNQDAVGGLVAQSDLHALHAVDCGVASGCTAKGSDTSIGHEAHMHQMVLHRFW